MQLAWERSRSLDKSLFRGSVEQALQARRMMLGMTVSLLHCFMSILHRCSHRSRKADYITTANPELSGKPPEQTNVSKTTDDLTKTVKGAVSASGES